MVVSSRGLCHLLLQAVNGPDADPQFLRGGIDADALGERTLDLLGLVRIVARATTFLGLTSEAGFHAF